MASYMLVSKDALMPSVSVIPILLGILVGLLLGLVAWGFWRARGHEIGDSLMGSRDDVLLGLLILAAFALGIFLTYALLNPNFY
jgi:hypothetical protein